jgi:tRNA threonylcarbamoyladenosine biosynthesis protein TsaB
VLALDTSTQSLHVGVLRGDTAEQVERELPGGAAGSETLIAALLDVLHEAGLRLDQVQAIAVGRGPGAFTGVRTACAVAQGLALGLGLPVLPIDTLQAVAEDARALLAGAITPGSTSPALCCVAMDARMGELYCALYEVTLQGIGAERWPAQLMTPPQLLERLRTHERQTYVLAGNGVDVHAQALAPLLGGVPLCVADARPRASALLRLARRAWLAGRSRDAAQALPLYVRDKVALTTEEREAARAAAAHASTQATP